MISKCLVFEYKSGGELLHLIEKYGPLSEEIARIYVAEIAVAIGIWFTTLYRFVFGSYK